MTTNTFDQRLQEAAQTRRDFRIELLTIGVIAGFIGGWFLFGANRPLSNDGYITNVFTELISIGLTVFVITEIVKRREIAETKRQLIQKAGSNFNYRALDAIETARENGWLDTEDGLLAGQDLLSANLKDANLQEVNLRSTDLHGANLQKANLKRAQLQYASLAQARLQNAYLVGANLQEAYLWWANLKEAILIGANLKDANLEDADLSGANLANANLVGANLKDAIFDKTTILPDATLIGSDDEGNAKFNKFWTPETDMAKYIDPEQHDFYSPTELKFIQIETNWIDVE